MYIFIFALVLISGLLAIRYGIKKDDCIDMLCGLYVATVGLVFLVLAISASLFQ